MSVDRALRLIAGAFVFASVMLGMFVHPNFYCSQRLSAESVPVGVHELVPDDGDSPEAGLRG